jgi:FkbM family methyltransferase
MTYYNTFKKRDQIINFTKESLSYNKNWCYNWFISNYENWENETFDVFDKFLNKDKVFIDIGGWIGTTCLYGANKSKYVYVIEADPLSVNGLISNCKLNNLNNITVIDRAIYIKDDIDIKFGRNIFTKAEWNTSTSQILIQEKDYAKDDFTLVKTITLKSIIEKYNIDPNTISLIKVDIEGGEENILEELFAFHQTYKVPLYVGFHVKWWKDKNINRFTFLTDEHLKMINKDNFISILFE